MITTTTTYKSTLTGGEYDNKESALMAERMHIAEEIAKFNINTGSFWFMNTTDDTYTKRDMMNILRYVMAYFCQDRYDDEYFFPVKVHYQRCKDSILGRNNMGPLTLQHALSMSYPEDYQAMLKIMENADKGAHNLLKGIPIIPDDGLCMICNCDGPTGGIIIIRHVEVMLKKVEEACKVLYTYSNYGSRETKNLLPASKYE